DTVRACGGDRRRQRAGAAHRGRASGRPAGRGAAAILGKGRLIAFTRSRPGGHEFAVSTRSFPCDEWHPQREVKWTIPAAFADPVGGRFARCRCFWISAQPHPIFEREARYRAPSFIIRGFARSRFLRGPGRRGATPWLATPNSRTSCIARGGRM